MIKVKRIYPAWPKAEKAEKSCPPALNVKQAKTHYLLHAKVVVKKIGKKIKKEFGSFY